jgi:hypothetical protein
MGKLIGESGQEARRPTSRRRSCATTARRALALRTPDPVVTDAGDVATPVCPRA